MKHLSPPPEALSVDLDYNWISCPRCQNIQTFYWIPSSYSKLFDKLNLRIHNLEFDISELMDQNNGVYNRVAILERELMTYQTLKKELDEKIIKLNEIIAEHEGK